MLLWQLMSSDQLMSQRLQVIRRDNDQRCDSIDFTTKAGRAGQTSDLAGSAGSATSPINYNLFHPSISTEHYVAHGII